MPPDAAWIEHIYNNTKATRTLESVTRPDVADRVLTGSPARIRLGPIRSRCLARSRFEWLSLMELSRAPLSGLFLYWGNPERAPGLRRCLVMLKLVDRIDDQWALGLIILGVIVLLAALFYTALP